MVSSSRANNLGSSWILWRGLNEDPNLLNRDLSTKNKRQGQDGVGQGLQCVVMAGSPKTTMFLSPNGIATFHFEKGKPIYDANHFDQAE
jgi:hypothetical protein